MLLLSTVWCVELSAQWNLSRDAGLIVQREDASAFKNPWAGGLNSPQFSPIDLDLDGDDDLFAFDRIGNKPFFFEQVGDTPGSPEYVHRPQWNAALPNDLIDWVLFRDLDCDGLPDLITAFSNGMKWYRNTSVPGAPAFELADELIVASYNLSGSPFEATLFCLSVDIPSLEDIDGDGDLDIFTWSDAATTIFYFKNLAVENGDCSQPEFTCANRCYGKLSEASEDFTIFYGDAFICPFNVIDPEFDGASGESRSRHAGGVLLQIDLDQNGILDLILSDVTDPHFTAMLLEECPDGQDSAIVAQTDFPVPNGAALATELRVFPAGYYFDADLDGIKDLIVSPNNTVATEDNESVWFYKNTGANDLPVFALVQEDFLQRDMLDFGRGAYPVAFDYNGDGLMDLVVANKEYNEDIDVQPSQLALLENVGTLSDPVFQLIDRNYLNLPQYGLESVYPAFGDLDADGDMDLILGEEGGGMHFFRNNASGDEALFELEIPSIQDAAGGNLDVGQFSTPQLWDVNGDDLLDLIVGEKNGNVNYVENVGTPASFSFQHMIDTIGDAVASNFLGINGYSVPHLFLNPDGEWELLVGSEVGYVNHYTGIQGNFEGTFNLEAEVFQDIWEGTYAAPMVIDINGDDTLDVFVGNRGGGLAFYNGGEVTVGTHGFADSLHSFHLYPNPAQDHFTVRVAPGLIGGQLRLYDLTGQRLLEVLLDRATLRVETDRLASGVYLVQAAQGTEQSVRRLVVR